MLNRCKEAIEKLNTEEATQPEENLNYDELFSLSQAVVTDQTITDTESSQTESQASQIPLITPSKIQNTKNISTSSKRKRGRKSSTSKSPKNNNNNNKSTSDSESSSDKSTSSISYKTPNNNIYNKSIKLTETQSEPIKKRLRSYTKNHSIKSSPLIPPQSQFVTKLKPLYKPRNSSKPITKTTLLKRNITKKRKEMRYINTSPLPVNDLSQLSSQQDDDEENKEKDNKNEEIEKIEKEENNEKDNNIIIDDEINQNNKDNLLPQSPDTEPDSPILQSITLLQTNILETSSPHSYIRPLDSISILKPKPKRVKLTPVLLDDVVVDKKFSDNNSEDRIKSSLSDIFGSI